MGFRLEFAMGFDLLMDFGMGFAFWIQILQVFSCVNFALIFFFFFGGFLCIYRFMVVVVGCCHVGGVGCLPWWLGGWWVW